jgi:hypothetical protein
MPLAVVVDFENSRNNYIATTAFEYLALASLPTAPLLAQKCVSKPSTADFFIG